MDYRVELFPDAIKEMDESAYWYEKHVDGLGEDFINIVYKSFSVIALNPLAYPKKKRYREFLVKKFPYLIIYEILEKERLINVLHISIPAVILNLNIEERGWFLKELGRF